MFIGNLIEEAIMSVQKVQDLVQLLQHYYQVHQQIHSENPNVPYVFGVDDNSATISAFEPVKVSVSFVSENAGYSNLAGAILLSDLLKASPEANVLSLFQDQNRDFNRTIDGVEKGYIRPYFVDKFNIDINGGWLDGGNSDLENPTSVTLFPGDVMANYLLTGRGHNPARRNDFLISMPEAGSLKHEGIVPPEGSYVKVTDNGDGTYTVAWEDLTGGGDRDFDDVVLKFDVERIPVYKGVASVNIPETATEHNTYAFQLGNAVIEAWYEYNQDTGKPEKLWFKTTALADLPEGYKFKLTGPNGEDLPNVGGNPFTLRSLKKGETDIQYFAPVTGPVRLTVISPAVATIEKRAVVGYDTVNINFGDKHETYQIPQLDVTHLTWGKYEVVLPDVVNNLTGEKKFSSTKVTVTVPSAVSVENVTPRFTAEVKNFNIEKPEKPKEPKPEDYATPEEYEAAMEEYSKKLEEYYNAVATYQAAQAAVDMMKTGEQQSLEIEKAAIDAVNSIVKGYLIDAISNLKTSFQANMEDINKQKAEYEQLVNKLRQQLANTTDETQREAIQEEIKAYEEAVEELAKANADLGKQAVEFAKEMVKEFKDAIKDIINDFSSQAKEYRAEARNYLSQAQSLEGEKNADYYIAYGQAVLYDALASGFEQGAKIATAVLESYISVDVSENPEVADALESVDVANVNVSI